jgi:hypothetical protein
MKKNNLLQKVVGLSLCAGLLILLSGCAIVPNYPSSSPFPETVDSLQPEFKWWGGSVSKKYDLAIWTAFRVDSGRWQHRKKIYEKTGLSERSHKVAIVLEPDSTYFWSVRQTGSTKWTTEPCLEWYDEFNRVGFIARDNMFRFQTPKAN